MLQIYCTAQSLDYTKDHYHTDPEGPAASIVQAMRYDQGWMCKSAAVADADENWVFALYF